MPTDAVIALQQPDRRRVRIRAQARRVSSRAARPRPRDRSAFDTFEIITLSQPPMSSTLASVSCLMRAGGRRIGEAREERARAVVAAPDREEVGEARLIRDVRIAVERRVAAGRARRGDAREGGVELAPVPRALRLEMRDL